MLDMICNKCGNNCNDEDACCTNCGYPLPINNQSVPQNGQSFQNVNNNVQNNGQYQNMNYNYNMPNNGQYQNMNYNYNMPNNGQYQNMNYNYPNRKVKSSAGIITAIVAIGVIGFIALIVIGFVVTFPLIKSLFKNNMLHGEWYCSATDSNVTEETAPAHVFLNYDNTFTWAKNGDEDNNYYSGDFKITEIEIKKDKDTTGEYRIYLTPNDGKINGEKNTNLSSVPSGYDVAVSRNEEDDKVHAVFTSSSGSKTWNCVKKGD